MENPYQQRLIDTLTDKDNLSLVKKEAAEFYQGHTIHECYDMAMELYKSDYFQLQEIGVLLCGYIGSEQPKAFNFLKETVSLNPSWKVQEVLAMAFDSYCKNTGYEKAIPVIEDWLRDKNENVRRAVSEGLRIWTSRPYFKENPQKAIDLLAVHRDDESEYFRKSVGNALRDISKKYPELIKKELESWDTSSKRTMQVYQLAGKFIFTKSI